MVSLGLARIPELDRDLSLEDCFDLLEIYQVSKHNEKVIREYLKKQNER